MKEEKLDSSISSQESEDSDLDSKEQVDYKARWITDTVPTLIAGRAHTHFQTPLLVVSGPVIITGMPTRSTSEGSSQKGENIIQATLGDSPLRTSPITTFSVLASLARHSRLPEKGKGLETLVGCFSTRSPALRGLKDPHYYSWKTSKDSSATTKGRPLELSWKSWGVLAIDSNGRCSTLSGSAYPKIGNVSSLLDILEAKVEARYFLSKRLVDSLLEHKRRHKEKGHGFGMNIIAFQEASESEEVESKKA